MGRHPLNARSSNRPREAHMGVDRAPDSARARARAAARDLILRAAGCLGRGNGRAAARPSRQSGPLAHSTRAGLSRAGVSEPHCESGLVDQGTER